MRLFNKLIFDEWQVGSSPSYTASSHHELLGSAGESFGLHFVVDQVTANDTVKYTMDMSGDGLNWIQVGAGAFDVTAGATTSGFQSIESAGAVFLQFIRLSVFLQGGATGHVKIHACGRGRVRPASPPMDSPTPEATKSCAGAGGGDCGGKCESGSAGCGGGGKAASPGRAGAAGPEAMMALGSRPFTPSSGGVIIDSAGRIARPAGRPGFLSVAGSTQ